MDAKKAVLLGAFICQTILLVHGTTSGTFNSTVADSTQTFPQTKVYLRSPNNLYYTFFYISSSAGEGMLCYFGEANSTNDVLAAWGGIAMVGDYSATDTCALVMDDQGYIAVRTTLNSSIVFDDLTAVEKSNLNSVVVALFNNGTFTHYVSNSPPSSSPSPPPPTILYPPPPQNTPSPPSPPPPNVKTSPSPPPPPSGRNNIFQGSSVVHTPFFNSPLGFILWMILLIGSSMFMSM